MRTFVSLVLLGSAFFSASAQTPESQACSVGPQLKPALRSNPKAVVTFACRDATALALIDSIGRQTRIPIGIVFGQDPYQLSKTKRTYRLFDLSAKSALLEAVSGTDYTVSRSEVGFLITAGDLTTRQRELLLQKLVGFHGSNVSMVMLGSLLTMWMQNAIDHPQAFMASILGSTDDEQFTLQALPPLTVQQIANRIVSLGSKGMWILTTDPVQKTSEWTDEVSVEPYQHYSNLPAMDH